MIIFLPPYTILSHTWTEGQEAIYNNLVSDIHKDKAGYTKIYFYVNRAIKDGLQYSWIKLIKAEAIGEAPHRNDEAYSCIVESRICYAVLSEKRLHNNGC